MNFQAFLSSFSVMWQGMLGIFVVVAVIVLCVVLLRKIFPNKNKDSENK